MQREEEQGPPDQMTAQSPAPPGRVAGRGYRSLFWAIVLIGAGVVALLFNLDAIDPASLGMLTYVWPIIVIGVGGLAGLTALWAFVAFPTLLLMRVYPARQWADPRLAPAVGLATTLLLWALDSLVNSMLTPVYPAIAGALVSLVAGARHARNGQPRRTHSNRSWGERSA